MEQPVTLPLVPLQSGCSVPETASATIFSVHDSSINLAVGSKPELISLTTEAGSMTVTSVLYTAPEGFPGFSGTGLTRGASCTLESGGLWFDHGVRLALPAGGDNAPYQGLIEPTLLHDPSPTAKALAEAILKTGSSRAVPGVSPVARLLVQDREGQTQPFRTEPADSLAAAVIARAAELVLRVSGGDTAFLSELLGLGPGLTPSGDDFVVGFLAARALAGSSVAEHARARIADRLSATTRPGATIVSQALRGAFPAYLVRFSSGVADAVSRPGTSDEPVSESGLRSLVTDAAGHGASSGLDAVTGFAFGLR
jgi:hypothetical protein